MSRTIIDKVLALKNAHRETWRNEPETFWLDQLQEEMAELTLSLHGKHEHSPDLELQEIASIALNWLEMRKEQS